jgi:hypothetical protein
MNAEALIKAAENGDVEVIRNLSSGMIDKESRDMALMRAASNGHLDAVYLLIRMGADVNARRRDGMTPLIRAAFFGQVNVVRTLIENGADMNAVDRLGLTAMDWAISKGHTKVFQLLSSALAQAIPVDVNTITSIGDNSINPSIDEDSFEIDNFDQAQPQTSIEDVAIHTTNTNETQNIEDKDLDFIAFELDEIEIPFNYYHTESFKQEPVKEELIDLTDVQQEDSAVISLDNQTKDYARDFSISIPTVYQQPITEAAPQTLTTAKSIQSDLLEIKRLAAMISGVLIGCIVVIYLIVYSGKETVAETNSADKMTIDAPQPVRPEPDVSSVPLLYNYPKRRATSEAPAVAAPQKSVNTEKKTDSAFVVDQTRDIPPASAEKIPNNKQVSEPTIIGSSDDSASQAVESGLPAEEPEPIQISPSTQDAKKKD